MNLLKYSGGAEAIIKIDNYLYAMLRKINAFIKIDLGDGSVCFIGSVPNEKIVKDRLYSDLVYFNGKIYFVPLSADEIAVYDIKNDIFEKIPFADNKTIYNSKIFKKDYKFSKGLVKENYVYFFSCTYPAILKLNIKTNCIEYVTNWVKAVENKITYFNDGYMRSFFYDDNLSIYFPMCCENFIMKYDLSTDECLLYEVGNTENSYSDIVFYKNNYYISSKNGHNVIKTDNKFNVIFHYEDTKMVTSKMELYCDGIYMYLNDKNRITKITSDDNVKNIALSEGYATGVCSDKNLRYILPYGNENLLIFNLNSCEEKKMELNLSNEFNNFLFLNLKCNNYFRESAAFELEDFFNTASSKNDKDSSNIDIGKNIFRIC